jgi:Ca-activated chloride channel family protein
MMWRVPTPAVAGALAVASTAGLLSAMEPQVFRGGTDVVSLSVTVTDAAGHFVTGLDRPDFQVFEDGALQDISNFARDPQPIALSILLDTSASMEKKIAVAQEAAVGFVKRLGPDDVAEVIAFNSRAQIIQPFTADRMALEQAIRRVEVGGSTSLYNALYMALSELKGMRAPAADRLRRQAIVVLSDGEDTSSLVAFDDVLDSSKRSEVDVYAIGLRSKDDGPVHGFNEAEYVLRTLSQETGGRVFFVTDAAQLQAIYQQIADELANQYALGYVSKNPRRDGAWRRIVVRVSRKETTVRTKSGYFGPTAGR